jgi:hypothetical protein
MEANTLREIYYSDEDLRQFYTDSAAIIRPVNKVPYTELEPGIIYLVGTPLSRQIVQFEKLGGPPQRPLTAYSRVIITGSGKKLSPPDTKPSMSVQASFYKLPTILHKLPANLSSDLSIPVIPNQVPSLASLSMKKLGPKFHSEYKKEANTFGTVPTVPFIPPQAQYHRLTPVKKNMGGYTKRRRFVKRRRFEKRSKSIKSRRFEKRSKSIKSRRSNKV